MFTRTRILTAVMVMAVALMGCSDDTIEIIKSDGFASQDQTDVQQYFPIEQGYTTTFAVRSSNGYNDIVRFEVGKTISLGDVDVVEWIGRTDTEIEKNYLRVSDDAVYLYESLYANPEKILQVPLIPGESWERYEDDSEEEEEDIFVDLGTGEEDADTTGGISDKTFPTAGSLTMSVEKIERLELNDGNVYSHTVKITNLNGTGKNYYWFAPGVGLIRYVIGAYDTDGENGQIVGELVAFGY